MNPELLKHGPVPGTQLVYLGPAPRLSAANRAPMAWFYCTRCDTGYDSIKMIRKQHVNREHTVSCGCKGRKQFIDYHEQRAAQVKPETRAQVFHAWHQRRNKRVHFVRHGGKMISVKNVIAAKLNLTGYLLDFVLAAHKRFIVKVAALGRWAVNLLTAAEREALGRISSHKAHTASVEARKQRHAGVHWRDLPAVQVEDRRREATVWAEIEAAGGIMAIVLDLSVDLELA